MKTLASLRLPLLLLVFAFHVFSGSGTLAAERARIEAFLKVTGFDVALNSIALSAADAPEMLGMSASDFGGNWSRIAGTVFEESRMHEMALGILEETLSDELLNHAAEFYGSPLGQRLVEVENDAHMIEDVEAKHEKGEAIVARGVADSDPRIGVLRDLNAAIGGTGDTVRAIQEIQVRFLMAASYAGVIEMDLDEAALRAVLKEREDALRLSVQKTALASAAYTYQAFSESELRDYLAALRHPKMREVYELMNAIQHEIMANRFEVLAVRMAELHPGQEL